MGRIPIVLIGCCLLGLTSLGFGAKIQNAKREINEEMEEPAPNDDFGDYLLDLLAVKKYLQQ